MFGRVPKTGREISVENVIHDPPRKPQIFINLADNYGLDDQSFAPFATVTSGMDVVDKVT